MATSVRTVARVAKYSQIVLVTDRQVCLMVCRTSTIGIGHVGVSQNRGPQRQMVCLWLPFKYQAKDGTPFSDSPMYTERTTHTTMQQQA